MEKKKKEPDNIITIIIKGALIQDIDIPPHLRGLKVIVKDYDVDSFDDEFEVDDDGKYKKIVWESE